MDKVRDLLGTVSSSGISGTIGNEYLLNFDVNGNIVGLDTLYNLVNMERYGITEASDVFKAPVTSSFTFNIDGLGGVDLLDYSDISDNVTINFIIGRVSRINYDSSYNIVAGRNDLVQNFERGFFW